MILLIQSLRKTGTQKLFHNLILARVLYFQVLIFLALALRFLFVNFNLEMAVSLLEQQVQQVFRLLQAFPQNDWLAQPIIQWHPAPADHVLLHQSLVTS